MGPDLIEEFTNFARRIYEQTGHKVLNFTLDPKLFDLMWLQVSSRIPAFSVEKCDPEHASLFSINTGFGTITFEREIFEE